MSPQAGRSSDCSLLFLVRWRGLGGAICYLLIFRFPLTHLFLVFTWNAIFINTSIDIKGYIDLKYTFTLRLLRFALTMMLSIWLFLLIIILFRGFRCTLLLLLFLLAFLLVRRRCRCGTGCRWLIGEEPVDKIDNDLKFFWFSKGLLNRPEKRLQCPKWTPTAKCHRQKWRTTPQVVCHVLRLAECEDRELTCWAWRISLLLPSWKAVIYFQKILRKKQAR